MTELVVECSSVLEKTREEGERLFLDDFVPCLLLLIVLPRAHCESPALQEIASLICVFRQPLLVIENEYYRSSRACKPVDARKFGNHVSVRSAVPPPPPPPYYHCTDADNRERASAKDKKNKKEKRRSSLRKK